jgi:uncharacterized protein
MTKSNFEIRHNEITDLEVRSSEDSSTFTGYAAVFNSDSEPLPFIERIAPGAFTRTLESRNHVKMFLNHNTDIVLASNRSGTLQLTEDERGLRVTAELPPTTAGNDLKVLLKRGIISQMSFGFHIPNGGDSWSDGGKQRTLNEIALHEVSVVSGFPAYESTSAMVRTIARLAQRTQMDQDTLADAFSAFQSGEKLNADQVEVITQAVERQKMKTAEPDQDVSGLLATLAKRLDFLESTAPAS